MSTTPLTPRNPATSAKVDQVSSGSAKTSCIINFIKPIESDLQAHQQIKQIERELHQERVKSLRKELDYLNATEWKYKPVERNDDQRYKY